MSQYHLLVVLLVLFSLLAAGRGSVALESAPDFGICRLPSEAAAGGGGGPVQQLDCRQGAENFCCRQTTSTGANQTAGQFRCCSEIEFVRQHSVQFTWLVAFVVYSACVSAVVVLVALGSKTAASRATL